MIGAYIRVSTHEQADSGLGLDAQRRAIEHYCKGRGLEIAEWFEDHASADTPDQEDLERALLLLEGGRLEGLVVAKLDRLSRSVMHSAQLFRQATEQEWALISIDPAVDMTTPYGRAMAQMATVFAELERELIRQRTRAAMAEMRARGELIGRPCSIDPATVARIMAMYERGLSPSRICRILERDSVPNSKGEPVWYDKTVARIIDRERLLEQHVFENLEEA